MAKIELTYSPQTQDYVPGRAYANPRFFTTPRTDVAKVFLVGDWPQVEEAYTAIGVPVERLDPEAATARPETAKLPASLVSDLADAQKDEVAIPDGWRDLSWTQPDADGLTLRRLATKFSAAPVLNKAEAVAVIEAELERRAAAEKPEAAE